jgi:hypothetical protein
MIELNFRIQLYFIVFYFGKEFFIDLRGLFLNFCPYNFSLFIF